MKGKIRISLFLLMGAFFLMYGEHTVVYRNGASPSGSYTKCWDTSVSSTFNNIPFGENKHLSLSGKPDLSYVLLKYKLDVDDYLPPDTRILKAELCLYPKVYTGICPDTRWYLMGSEWDEKEATWNVAKTGVTWETPGGEILVTRRSSPLQIKDDCHAWDVTELVRSCVKFPARNFGFLLRGNPGTEDYECWYYSSETQRMELRPKLTVVYMTAEEVEELERKKKEEAEKAKKKAVEDMLEQKKEEKKEDLSKTPPPESPWRVQPLKRVKIKDWKKVSDIPFYVKRLAHSNNNGVLRDSDAPKASSKMQSRYGKVFGLRSIKQGIEEEKKLGVFIKSGVYITLDQNGDGSLTKEEQHKIKRGVAGPICVSNIYSTRKTNKVRHDYCFFVYKRNRDASSHDHWGMRHGEYLFTGFNGMEIRLYDENDNCSYNDYGQDKISVNGKLKFLNKYMDLGGEWWKIQLPPTGEFIAFAKPAELEEPPVKLVALNAADFNGGELQYYPEKVLFTCVDRDRKATYTVTDKKRVIVVPSGQYKIFYGRLKSRKKRYEVLLDGKDMRAIDLRERKTYSLKWGLPVSINVAPIKKGQKYRFKKENIFFKGVSGARYSLLGGKKLLLNPPTVEFYHDGKRETKRQIVADSDGGYHDLVVETEEEGKYRITMTAKTFAFGEISGETVK